MKRILVAVLLAPLAMTSPALAAEFYVVKDTAANKCRVVETKPDGQTLVMVGEKPYATKEEAKAAKKKATECNKPKAEKEADKKAQTQN